jgi:hypothetical protein
VAKHFHQCAATPRKCHNHKGELGYAGLLFSLKLFLALLYCIRSKIKQRRIIEHGADLRSMARNNGAGNESNVYTLF